MRYYNASAVDYAKMPLRLFVVHLVNFRKVHKHRLNLEAQLHGAKLK